MKKFFLAAVILLTLLAAYMLSREKQQGLMIGVVVPVQHQAMEEIVKGLSDTLNKEIKKPFTLRVENAQNDSIFLRAIIQKYKDAKVDIVVPIGTAATEMTLGMIHDQQIVSLASTLTDEQRKKRSPCNAAVVHDEIPVNKSLEFIHKLYPNLNKLVLIHSSSEKVLPEVKLAMEAAKQQGIVMKSYMINSLPELYSVSRAIPSDTQGIFILKDILVVSGVSTLVNLAKEKNIALIASDQGSVEEGAHVALGVQETQIGIEGGLLIANILKGAKACNLPIGEFKKLNVFVNNDVAIMQDIKANGLEKLVHELDYSLTLVSKKQITKDMHE